MAFLSATSIIVTLLNTLIIAAVFVGIIALEVWLSRRKSRWPGLVLPSLTYLLSLCVTFGAALYAYVPTEHQSFGDILVPTLLLFLMYNIPTLVLLGIYFACREKYSRKKQLDKMNIQDLDG